MVKKRKMRLGPLLPLVVQVLSLYYFVGRELRRDGCTWFSITVEGAAASVVMLFCFTATLLPLATFSTWLYGPRLIRRCSWLLCEEDAEFCCVWFLWNTHLINYAFLIFPFSVLVLFDERLACTDAIVDYVMFTASVSSPLIIGTGALKVLSSRCRLDWTWRQQSYLGMICAPSTMVGMNAFSMYRSIEEFRVASVMATLWYVYVILTMLERPECTGARAWPRKDVRRWQGVWDLAIQYLSLKVKRDRSRNHIQRKKERPSNACLMAFHPHGIIPFTAGLMWLHRDWPTLFPGVEPIFLTDGFIHSMPLTKDLVQWLGCREVTRQQVDGALAKLSNPETIIIVPGGQREIASTRSFSNVLKVYNGHKGFIKYVLKHRASLVPVVSFGEWNLMENIKMPFLQSLSRKIFGFPFPFVPFGATICMPRRSPVTIVVGDPVDYGTVSTPPSSADIERVHKIYFRAVNDIFERNKKRCGFPHVTIDYFH